MTYVGRLYAIRSRNTEKMYVGFTFETLVEALSEHVYHHINGVKNETTEILDNGDYYIELLKKVQCERKQDMVSFQQNYIKNNPINDGIATNKKIEECPAKVNKYLTLCKCGIMVKTKSFNQHLKSKRHFNIMNGIPAKDWKELIKCECGATVTRKSMYKHVTTLKHHQKMLSINE